MSGMKHTQRNAAAGRPRKTARFQIFKTPGGKWAWELQPAAGSAIAQSAYDCSRKRDAQRSVRRTCAAIMRLAAGKLDLRTRKAVNL